MNFFLKLTIFILVSLISLLECFASQPVILILYPSGETNPSTNYEAMISQQKLLVDSFSKGSLKVLATPVDSIDDVESAIFDSLGEDEKLESLILLGANEGHQKLMFSDSSEFTGSDVASVLVQESFRDVFSNGYLKVYLGGCHCGFSTNNSKGFQDEFMTEAVSLNADLEKPFKHITSLAHPYLMSRRSYFKGVGELSLAFHTTGFYHAVQKVILHFKSFESRPLTSFLFSLFSEPKRSIISMSSAVLLILAFPKIFGPFYLVYTGLNQLGFKGIEMLQVGTVRELKFSDDTKVQTSRFRPVRRGLNSLFNDRALSCKSLVSY